MAAKSDVKAPDVIDFEALSRIIPEYKAVGTEKMVDDALGGLRSRFLERRKHAIQRTN